MNPAADLIRAYEAADYEAVNAHFQALRRGAPAWERHYRAYRAFRRTLYQYRPMQRLKAITFGLALLGILATFFFKHWLTF